MTGYKAVKDNCQSKSDELDYGQYVLLSLHSDQMVIVSGLDVVVNKFSNTVQQAVNPIERQA